MSSEFLPVPQERGDLVPPDRRPPTAVGSATPPAPFPPRRQRRFGEEVLRSIRKALEAMFDAADEVADELSKYWKRRSSG